MHLLLDHLTAAIMAGSVMLVLLVAQHRSREAALTATAFYAQKQHQLSFVEDLQRDLQAAYRLETVVERAEDSTFVFLAPAEPGSSTLHEVGYRRHQVGTRNGAPLYQVDRLVDGRRVGASPPSLTHWHIVARNEEGRVVESPADARQVYVHFELASPLASLTVLPRTSWYCTIHSPMLRTSAATP